MECLENIVWNGKSADASLNNGEICCFRPSELVLPRKE